MGLGARRWCHIVFAWILRDAALAGVVWRGQKPWLYPAIAATLFVIHTHIVFFRLKPDLSSSGRSAELPFLVGGACIVFACAFGGNWLLRKWSQSSSVAVGNNAKNSVP